ncbi:MAG: hypothetical protein Q9171_003017 [Xanthocarpia ochracea]
MSTSFSTRGRESGIRGRGRGGGRGRRGQDYLFSRGSSAQPRDRSGGSSLHSKSGQLPNRGDEPSTTPHLPEPDEVPTQAPRSSPTVSANDYASSSRHGPGPGVSRSSAIIPEQAKIQVRLPSTGYRQNPVSERYQQALRNRDRTLETANDPLSPSPDAASTVNATGSPGIHSGVGPAIDMDDTLVGRDVAKKSNTSKPLIRGNVTTENIHDQFYPPLRLRFAGPRPSTRPSQTDGQAKKVVETYVVAGGYKSMVVNLMDDDVPNIHLRDDGGRSAANGENPGKDTRQDEEAEEDLMFFDNEPSVHPSNYSDVLGSGIRPVFTGGEENNHQQDLISFDEEPTTTTPHLTAKHGETDPSSLNEAGLVGATPVKRGRKNRRRRKRK